MDIEEKLIKTECELRSQQGKIGITVIWGTCILCILVGILPLISGGMFNESAPNGTTANIVLSDNYSKLIISLSIPFIIGLTAGIILIKSSIKHIAKSYFATPVEDVEEEEEEEEEEEN